MSRHSRTRQSAPHAEQTTHPPSRLFYQDAPKVLSPNPAHNAGHDFRKSSIFPSAAIQRKGEGETGEMADVPVAGGGGTMIPDAVRAAMEGAFAQDFGDVRIHTGPEARQVGALAYTRGSDLHFQPGRYDPFSDTGRHLLGHELTHVVQQRAGRVAAPAQHKSEGAAPINADTGLEAEADHQGAKAARGERASVSGTGSGIQRKADGAGAPIQREEDDEFQTMNMNAALNPKGFLPSQRTPRQINALSNHQASLLPERSSVRPTTNNAQRAADTNKVAAFRGRMAGEMAAQKTMLDNNDALPADVDATQPTVKNPLGFSSFQTQQRSEREAELQALRDGTTTTPGVIRESPAASSNTASRPAKISTAMAPSKYVTAGTTAGATPYKGGEGDKVVTHSGPYTTSRLGSLENKLNNPSQSTAFVDHHGALKFPREGMGTRQQNILKTAKKADPLMQDLDNPAKANTLDHHRDKDQRTLADHWLRPTDRITNLPQHGGRTLTDAAQNPYYAVGAPQFTNAQKLLPTLNGPRGLINQANQNQSRPNVWSEADVTPTHVTSSWAGNRRANVGPRDGERLLHTHPTSRQETQDGKGRAATTTSASVDFRYQVTNDHYKSAVPVAPLQTGYKLIHPYAPSEMPPTPLAPDQFPVRPPVPPAPGGAPRTASRPLRPGESPSSPSSLNYQQSLDRDNQSGDAAAVAALASATRHAAQGEGEQAEDKAVEAARTGAGLAALTANGLHNTAQQTRDTAESARKDQTAAQAFDAAPQAALSANVAHNAAQETRDVAESATKSQAGAAAVSEAHQAALSANARREAEEEARTQADLKALAPSEGAQAMYGMSARTARSVAERQMEMQHQAARAWTGGDHIGDGPSTAHKPMSADAESMYG